MKKLIYLLMLFSLSSYADPALIGQWWMMEMEFEDVPAGSFILRIAEKDENDKELIFTMITVREIRTTDPTIKIVGQSKQAFRLEGKVLIDPKKKAVTLFHKPKNENCNLGNFTYTYSFEGSPNKNYLYLEDSQSNGDLERISQEKWDALFKGDNSFFEC